MASLAAVRTALGNTVSGVSALRVFPTFQQQINPPTAIIMPQRGQMITFDTLEGFDSYHLQIILMVSFAEDASSQAMMDAFLDAGPSASASTSVLMALRANPSLSGAVFNCVPVSVMGYGLTEWAGQQYFGCTINVQVQAGP